MDNPPDQVDPGATSEDVPPGATSEDVPPGATSEDVPPGATSEDVPPGATSEDVPPGATSEDVPPGATSEDVPPGATSEPTVESYLNTTLTTFFQDDNDATAEITPEEPKLPDQIPTGDEEPVQEKPFILPLYIYTAVFGAIFILGPLLVRRGPNRGITRCCIMLSAFCCWIFWMTTYIVQLNPLLGPRLSNETVAWIGYKWGKDPRLCVSSKDKDVEEQAAEAEPGPP